MFESTAHGPLLNPILPKETRPIALKWTLYDPTLNSLPLYEMDTAANWTEFSAALETWSWPTQNVVYADDQGHIAYHAVGQDSDCGPAGLRRPYTRCRTRAMARPRVARLHSVRRMPNAVDPPSGFLATANSRVTTEKSPYPLTLSGSIPIASSASTNRSTAATGSRPKTCSPCRPTSTAKWTRRLGQRLAYAIDHTAGSGRPAAQGRRPDAQLGWTADHRLRRRVDRDAGAQAPCGR